MLPAGVVVFGNSIFNCPDFRIMVENTFPEFDHLFRRLSALVRFVEGIDTVFKKLAGGRIEHEHDVLASFVTCLLNGFKNQLDRLFIGCALRCETAFIADARVVTLLVQNSLECVKGFRSRAQSFAVRRRSNRRNHELLKVHIAVRVAPAVQHIEPRRRDEVGLLPSEVCIKGKTMVRSSRPRNR